MGETEFRRSADNQPSPQYLPDLVGSGICCPCRSTNVIALGGKFCLSGQVTMVSHAFLLHEQKHFRIPSHAPTCVKGLTPDLEDGESLHPTVKVGYLIE